MKQSKETLKKYFETGDKPTQGQYADLIDSYIDAKQAVGTADRQFSIDEQGAVSVIEKPSLPVYTLSDIVNNKLSLLKDGVVVKEINLSPYLDDTNLARLTEGEVDRNGIATFTRTDGSEFTVDFSSLVGGGGAGGTATNLSYETAADQGKVVSSSGTAAVIPVATTSKAGLMKANYYTEGNFTPVFRGHSGVNEFTYNTTSAEGKYLRIGNLVYVTIKLTGITTPSNTIQAGSGAMSISLPFRSADLTLGGSLNISAFKSGNSGITLPTETLNAYVGVGQYTDRIKFNYGILNAGGTTTLPKVEFTNGAVFVSGCYMTNVYQ